MSILHHEIERAPIGEASLAPEGRTDLSPEDIDESFAIAGLGRVAIERHIEQLDQVILGSSPDSMPVGLAREIAVWRHSLLVAEG